MTKKLIKLIVLVGVEIALMVAAVKVYAETPRTMSTTTTTTTYTFQEPNKDKPRYAWVTLIKGARIRLTDQYVRDPWAARELIKRSGKDIKLSLSSTDKTYISTWRDLFLVCKAECPKNRRYWTAVIVYEVDNTKYVSVMTYANDIPQERKVSLGPVYKETWIVKSGTFNF